MILEMVMESLFGVVDMFFVARLGVDSLATVALTESLLVLVFGVALGLSMATTAFVARRIGEKDPVGAAEGAVQSIALGLLMSVLVGAAAILYAPHLLALMGGTESVVRTGTAYTRILLGGSVTIFLLFLINGVPASKQVLDLCDGIMIEYFGIVGKKDPDKLKQYMLDIVRLGRAGKIVMARAFPGFTFFDPEVRDWSYARKLAEAKKNVAFSLATYLAVAQRYTYLQYGWGYENIGGAYVLQADGVTPDPVWYPEFLAPLGEPLEDPVVDGYVFTRRFRHAAVRVDLQAREGRVDFSS